MDNSLCGEVLHLKFSEAEVLERLQRRLDADAVAGIESIASNGTPVDFLRFPALAHLNIYIRQKKMTVAKRRLAVQETLQRRRGGRPIAAAVDLPGFFILSSAYIPCGC